MTKSYNYIPTHFIYSSFLFFLLIFMYQLIHCHTLPKPFSQIFLFRIYAPTTYTHQPCLTLISRDQRSGFNKFHALTQPPQTNPPTTTDTHCRFHTHKFHTHTAPQTNSNRPPHTDTHPQTNTRRQTPTTLTPTHSTPTQPPPVRNPTGQMSDRSHTRNSTSQASTGHASVIRQTKHQQATHP